MLKNLITIISLSIMVCAIGYLFPKQTSFDFSQTGALIQQENKNISAKEPPAILAKSACVFDFYKNEYLFELNSDARLPLASLTKLMTALVAKENLPEGTLIKITKEAIEQTGDSGLKIDEWWKLHEIVDTMLLSSSNDAAFAIASSLSKNVQPDTEEFLNLMNKKARVLEMKQTYFFNTSGLDLSSDLAGAYGSCQDMTKLMRYMLQNHAELLEITSHESLELDGRVFTNTNELISKLPLFLAGKTGFDDLAGGNLTVAVNKGLNHPIIITVLGSTIEGRFEDVISLYDHFVK